MLRRFLSLILFNYLLYCQFTCAGRAIIPSTREHDLPPKRIYTQGYLKRRALAHGQLAKRRFNLLQKLVLCSPRPYAGSYDLTTHSDSESSVIYPASKAAHEYVTPAGRAALWEANARLEQLLTTGAQVAQPYLWERNLWLRYRACFLAKRDELYAAAALRDLEAMEEGARLHELDTRSLTL